MASHRLSDGAQPGCVPIPFFASASLSSQQEPLLYLRSLRAKKNFRFFRVFRCKNIGTNIFGHYMNLIDGHSCRIVNHVIRSIQSIRVQKPSFGFNFCVTFKFRFALNECLFYTHYFIKKRFLTQIKELAAHRVVIYCTFDAVLK